MTALVKKIQACCRSVMLVKCIDSAAKSKVLRLRAAEASA